MDFATQIRHEDLNYSYDLTIVLVVFLAFTILRLVLNFLVFGRKGPVKGNVTIGDRLMEEVWLGTISMFLVGWSWGAISRNNVGCSVLNTHACIKGWPDISLTRETELLMVVEGGWYIHQLCRDALGVGMPMERDLFIHHIATVGLIVTGMLKNLVILGMLMLALFNTSSPFMHIAKVAYYLDMRKLRVVLFALFAVVFFVTRVVMLPMSILKCMMIDAQKENVALFGWWLFYSGNALMHALYILQLVWMYRIVRVLWRGKTGSTPRAHGVKSSPFHNKEGTNGNSKKVEPVNGVHDDNGKKDN